MFLSSKVFAAFFAFALVFGASIAVNADTIKLKDGSVIKGKIVDFKNQQITIVRAGGGNRSGSQITVEADEVESIEFDSIENLVSLINTARPGVLTETGSTGANTNSNNSILTSNPSSSNNTSPIEPRPIPASTNNNSTVSTRAVTNPSVTQPAGGLSQVINSQPTSINNNPNPTFGGNGRFIPLSVKVLADNTANGWTNTGLVVKKGQRLRVSATGRISLGSGKYATPAGIGSIADNERLMKTEPTGALIAVIGDDNNDFIFIGSNRDFVAPRDGTLFLGVNEGNLNDNSGAFDTTVEAEATDATAQK
ncbi:MAG: LecA/PA-IL family lectin [Pyrinomonadaceae bacterium]